jgi:outer membrane receptor protein involved in Fe transport
MMTQLRLFASLLMCSSALVAAPAFAQTATPATPPAEDAMDAAAPETAADEAQPGDAGEDVDISGIGADPANEDIVVRGRFIPNPIRATPEVVSVLSAEAIARTGEGDIAGALQRVTGLSVVGGRFVYVRGLGERYSLALLNGAPLPSPEPLRRVIPLDLFPTAILASSVVQKSYSANFPGEFGGGVINLTTKTAPEEPFLDIGFSMGGDTETTGEVGYTYFGSRGDWTSFDSGERSPTGAFADALATGNRIVDGVNFTRAEVIDITQSLSNSRTNLIQRNQNIQPNFSGDLALGKTFELGGAELGVIAVAGYSNSWRTRGGLQEFGNISVGPDGNFLQPVRQFNFLSTENRIVLNGMLSLGLEFGEHRIRFNNLFIRDVLKESRVDVGNNFDTVQPGTERPDATIQTGQNSWYERQLFDTQVIAEFEFDAFSVDLRGTWAKSQRDAPYERSYSYVYNETVNDYVNDLRSPGQDAFVSFSELNDTVWAGGIDLSYEFATAFDFRLSGGYAYYDNDRDSIRRDFQFQPAGALPIEVAQLRIDGLLSDATSEVFNVLLTETTGGLGSAAFDAELTVHAGYLLADLEPVDGVRINIGARYEDGEQTVQPRALFGLPASATTVVGNDYWLPATTITWNFAEDMQLRLAASKTIARPQFRELAPQPYRDTDSGRTFFGNQFLTDSELINVEGRYEWYFDRGQRLTVAGFYKEIDRPIEAVAVQVGSSFFTTFANAPSAELYGVEFELEKRFGLDTLGDGAFWANRSLVVIANYTYSQSQISVGPDDTTISFSSAPGTTLASNVFDINGDLRLTGQSDHLVNLQLGLEDSESLSQQTLLVTYSSPRVTNRGPNASPDYIERPGVRLDFVARQGVQLFGQTLEMKFEARNLLGTDYREQQRLGDSLLNINSYDLGQSFSFGATLKF